MVNWACGVHGENDYEEGFSHHKGIHRASREREGGEAQKTQQTGDYGFCAGAQSDTAIRERVSPKLWPVQVWLASALRPGAFMYALVLADSSAAGRNQNTAREVDDGEISSDTTVGVDRHRAELQCDEAALIDGCDIYQGQTLFFITWCFSKYSPP